MKKILIYIFLSLYFLTVSSSSVFASIGIKKEIKNTIREKIQQLKEASVSPKEFREEIKNTIKEEIKEKEKGIIDKIKNLVKKNLRFNARIKGIVKEIGENSLKIESEGKLYLVNVTDKTKLIRRFGGESNLSEFSVGDEVNVFGKYVDENKTSIDANLVRNLSIQRRWGVFFGEILSKEKESFVIKTLTRGNLTVYLSSQTKILTHKKETIKYEDLQVGQRVRIKGVWDKTLNKIFEIEEIRVFPQKPVLTPTLTL